MATAILLARSIVAGVPANAAGGRATAFASKQATVLGLVHETCKTHDKACRDDSFPPLAEAAAPLEHLLEMRAGSIMGVPAAPEHLARFSAVLRQPVCATCSQGAVDKICRGTDESALLDQGHMDERGRCITPLKEIFAAVESQTRNAYIQAGANVPWATRFHTAIAEASQTRPFDLGVTAGVQRSGSTADVTLKFLQPRFWVDDYFCIPYVLTHELVAHAFCGVDPNAAEARFSTAFHDGWMDVVALWVFERSVGSLRTLLSSDWTDRFQTAARDAHTNRMSSLGAQAQQLQNTEWRTGADAMRRMAEMVGLVVAARANSLSAAQETDQLVVDLSLNLNASNVSHKDRLALVDALVSSFGEDSSESRVITYSRTPEGQRAVAAVGAYFEHRDANELVKKLLEVLA